MGRPTAELIRAWGAPPVTVTVGQDQALYVYLEGMALVDTRQNVVQPRPVLGSTR